jgi:hypothetical protein
MHQGLNPKVNTDAKKGHYILYQGDPLLPQKILKIRCPRLAKSAFAMQHLLHHIYIHTLLRWMHV